MTASNQSPEAITPEFAPKDTYKKLFALREETWPHLWEIGEKVAAACRPTGEIGTDGNRNLKVICLGYGEGWRDLPVLLGLLKQGCSCDVVAIEPTWSENGNAAKQFAISFIETLKLPYRVSTASESSDPFTVISTLGKKETCTIRVFNGTAEQWLGENRAICEQGSVDIVLAMCVLHLLSDWKASLGWFLDVALKPGGCLVAGETPGSISAFDGDFRRLHDDDNWHRAWRHYYQERARLLLPTAKAVSPKDMYMLREALELSGYTRLDPTCTDLKDGGPFCKQGEGVCSCCWTAYEHCTTNAEALKDVLVSSKDGSDAKTLGAFMIYDKDRATKLVDCLLTKAWPDNGDGDTEFSYRASYRYIAYRKPEAGAAASLKSRFPSAVAGIADNHAVSNAIEIKTSVKKTLNEHVRNIVRDCGIEKRVEELRRRRYHALGSVLFDMREMLCLSRDTFAVATSRAKRNYLSAVHLLPLSIVGSDPHKIERAAVLVAQHGRYLSVPTDQHINVLADKESVHDLSIAIVRGEDAQPSKSVTAVPFFSADGNVCHLQVEIPEAEWTKWASEYVISAARDLDHVVGYSDYAENEGFASFQTEVTFKRNGRQPSSNPDDVLMAEIRGALNGEHDLVEPLVLALTNARRLAMLHWLPKDHGEVPGWKACLYVMRRLLVDDYADDADRVAHVGVALLSLLSADDYEAWIKPEREAKPSLPRLVMAIEPFLSAIAEIEAMAHLEDQVRFSGLVLFEGIRSKAVAGKWFTRDGEVPHNPIDEYWERLISAIQSIGTSYHRVAKSLMETAITAEAKECVFSGFKSWLIRDGSTPLTKGAIALIFWLAGGARSNEVLAVLVSNCTYFQFTEFQNSDGIQNGARDDLTSKLHDLFYAIQADNHKHTALRIAGSCNLSKSETENELLVNLPWTSESISKYRDAVGKENEGESAEVVNHDCTRAMLEVIKTGLLKIEFLQTGFSIK